MNKRLKIKLPIFLLFILIILAAITSPFWGWQIKPKKTLEVLILDKTVPDETYREHKGVMWALNHLKYVQSDGTKYHLINDYIGFYPKKKNEYGIRNLPENLDPYQMIYIADGYGVYEEEFYESNQLGERSNIIYGGMTSEEIARIREAVFKNGTTLVAEFNTFASPTPSNVKEEFYQLLNIDWTGWIARYFEDLNSDEVPVWIRTNYESQTGESYQFNGSGYVFVNENDKVVILDKSQIGKEGVTFTFTENGESYFDEQTEVTYDYWFDVITPKNEKEVLATYNLTVNESGKDLLRANNIPLQFPAVVQHRNDKYTSYYFAGDYADQAELPGLYQTVGFTTWKKWMTSSSQAGTLPFFWKAYLPMMEVIFEETQGLQKATSTKVEFARENGVKVGAKVSDNYLQIYKNGKWEDILVKGVNMGIAKPGSWPGETNISKAEYYRWFTQIGDMNANVIRVYTIHPPAFYEALYEYNKIAKTPLYLLHGVWVNEEIFHKSQDAFAVENTEEFKAEIRDVIDLIHGNASLPERRGHSSGDYKYDVSPYVLGWILGVEWDPTVVLATNDKHHKMEDYKGEFIYTQNANPFEIWLAEMMNFTIEYEESNYDWQRLVSFTNWPTTDLLDHPSEPHGHEDMVSVNPNVIYSTDQMFSGLFASYHFYPYYPDFLNYEQVYVEYKDHRGEKNNYAGYLNEMKKNHRLPIVVAEFGVPGSRGLTHRNVHGRDQGHHSEEEQGYHNTRLFEDIVQEDMAGGIVFTWQDEWFKRTWNTMDYDNEDRRPYWSNAQTNEQQFGLLSFDPTSSFNNMLKVDGDPSDWSDNGIEPVITSNGKVTNVYVSSDERYLYLRLDLNEKLDEMKTYILFDTIQNQGQASIPGLANLKTEGIDFVLELKGEEHSRLLVDSYYDTFYYHYGNAIPVNERTESVTVKNNGVFHPIRLALNKEVTIRTETGENKTLPFDYYETGKLAYGNGNPISGNYNSLTDASLNQSQNIVEIRLPWQLLNFKDPSLNEVMGDIWSEGGLENSEIIEKIKIGVVVDNGTIETVPKANGSSFDPSIFYGYTLPVWEEPTYHERLKQSYYMMQDLYKSIDVKE
ncbi:hypothetical protein IMZ08_12780 [Bacillus luteolus]|uniref:Family 2 glycosyl transferase n=1 Tax=Litchfieldia luteola TaxID=682179 RepID=A0ABR9QKB4_9BACI|nr:hypothetical protein [Cytobacillus luteolus]MBE4908936.1 hypothetical protein [Cytobacillus luteolus]MBP1941795.1 hypothetical protein [Cytobacillus luteolus]